MARKHNKEHFYKFMTAETAKIVLKKGSLRWKAPKQFNDPFDHQMTFSFPFSHEKLTEILNRDIERLVYFDEEIVLADTALSKMISLLRKLNKKIPIVEFRKTLAEGIEGYANNFDELKKNINSLISGELNESRVMCVSEKNDNVVMWSHYAGEHTGICLRLQCIDEIDNTLLMAQPINYQAEFPEFPTVDKYVNYLTGEHLLSMADLLYKIPYIKHTDWSYENEWRVHVPHASEGTEGYDDWIENPRIFGGVYLGCRISPKDASEIIHLANSLNAEIEIYRATQSKAAFILEFEQIK